MTVIAFDRRADHVVVSRPRMIESTTDIDALAAETYAQLERAHTAHWTNEPTAFLRAITKAGEKVVHIGKIAREISGELDTAPAIDPNQLALWVRPDGAVATDHRGTAA